MKKMIFIIAIMISSLFASQLQYFYTDKIYAKIHFIKFIKTKTLIKDVKIKEDTSIYRHEYIPVKFYYYEVNTDDLAYIIKCNNKINFVKITADTNILNQYNCKIISAR